MILCYFLIQQLTSHKAIYFLYTLT